MYKSLFYLAWLLMTFNVSTIQKYSCQRNDFECQKILSFTDLQKAQQKIDKSPAGPRGRLTILPKNTKVPELKIIHINTRARERDCCIITYASYNKSYQHLIKTLIKQLKKTFKGHILYRVGGWPNMEMGCLDHSEVPYAFKVCAFMEAYRLGYKKVLWLDTLVEPLKNIMPIFDHIEKKLCVYRYSLYPFKKKVNQPLLDDFHLSRKEVKDYPHIATGILGFNFKSPRIVSLLHAWHNSVKRKKSFFTSFPEQLPLSVLLHKYGFDNCSFGPDLVSILPDIIDGTNSPYFKIDYRRK